MRHRYHYYHNIMNVMNVLLLLLLLCLSQVSSINTNYIINPHRISPIHHLMINHTNHNYNNNYNNNNNNNNNNNTQKKKGKDVDNIDNTNSGNNKIAFMYLTRGYMPFSDLWDEFFRWHNYVRVNYNNNNNNDNNSGNGNVSEEAYYHLNHDNAQNDYSIYVHPHKHVQYHKDSIFYQKDVPGHTDIKWNDISQIHAMKRLVSTALLDTKNQWFALISEACVPLHPLSLFLKSLRETKKSIVNSCPNLSEQDSDINLRWNKELEKVGLKREQWRKSSQWFLISRKHAELFVQDTRLINGFRPTYANDEHYLPMLISYHGLEHETTCAGDFVTASFVPGEPHPILYHNDDISKEVLQRLEGPRDGKYCSNAKEICHFTARKFAMSAKQGLLEHLPVILHGHDQYPAYNKNPFWHDQLRLRKLLPKDHPRSQQDQPNQKDDIIFILKDHDYYRRIPDPDTAKAMHLDISDPEKIKFVDIRKHELRGKALMEPFLSRKDGLLYQLLPHAVDHYEYKDLVFFMQDGKKHRIVIEDNVLQSFGKNYTALFTSYNLNIVGAHTSRQLDEIIPGEPIPFGDIKKFLAAR